MSNASPAPERPVRLFLANNAGGSDANRLTLLQTYVHPHVELWKYAPSEAYDQFASRLRAGEKAEPQLWFVHLTEWDDFPARLRGWNKERLYRTAFLVYSGDEIGPESTDDLRAAAKARGIPKQLRVLRKAFPQEPGKLVDEIREAVRAFEVGATATPPDFTAFAGTRLGEELHAHADARQALAILLESMSWFDAPGAGGGVDAAATQRKCRANWRRFEPVLRDVPTAAAFIEHTLGVPAQDEGHALVRLFDTYARRVREPVDGVEAVERALIAEAADELRRLCQG